MKIAIAITCYNCESQIVRVLTELNPILKEQKLIEEVFIIDNKSEDRTLSCTIENVDQLENKHIFSVYQNFENIGLGGSHKIAFSLAKSSGMTHLLLLHGDHQASAADIPNLIQNLLIENGVTTLGSRFINLKNLTGYSQHRKIGNIILNFIYSSVTKTKIWDLGSGLNIFRLDDFDEKIYQCICRMSVCCSLCLCCSAFPGNQSDTCIRSMLRLLHRLQMRRLRLQ